MEETPERDYLVISLMEARLDAVIAPSFRETLISRIDQGCQNIVLDLGQVSFLDSSGLGALVFVLKHLVHKGGRLHICGVTPGVMSVLKLTRMDRVLKTFDSRQAAIAA